MARLKSSASQEALDKILLKINNYELSSRNIVSDLELSREFNMSRTPIREAISRLIDAGVLERTATKVIVKPITLEDIKEILTVKEAIELMSVRIILKEGKLSITKEKELSSIHEVFTSCISRGNFEEIFLIDSAFHTAIIECSGNSRFLEINRQLTIQMQRLRWINILTPSQFSIAADEHDKILLALREKNSEKTEHFITLHCQNAIKNYSQIISNPHWGKLMQELSSMKI